MAGTRQGVDVRVVIGAATVTHTNWMSRVRSTSKNASASAQVNTHARAVAAERIAIRSSSDFTGAPLLLLGARARTDEVERFQPHADVQSRSGACGCPPRVHAESAVVLEAAVPAFAVHRSQELVPRGPIAVTMLQVHEVEASPLRSPAAITKSAINSSISSSVITGAAGRCRSARIQDRVMVEDARANVRLSYAAKTPGMRQLQPNVQVVTALVALLMRSHQQRP